MDESIEYGIYIHKLLEEMHEQETNGNEEK